MIDGLLHHWAHKRRLEDDPGLDAKPPGWVNQIPNSNIFKPPTVCDYSQEETERLDMVVNAMPQFKYNEHQVLMIQYVWGWYKGRQAKESDRIKMAQCSRKTYFKRLREAKDYLRRYF